MQQQNISTTSLEQCLCKFIVALYDLQNIWDEVRSDTLSNVT